MPLWSISLFFLMGGVFLGVVAVPVPSPFDPSLLQGSPMPSETSRNNNTAEILTPGSPQYDYLVQRQREWNGGGLLGNGTSGNHSIFRNYTCDPSNPQLCVHSLRDKQIRLENIRNYVLNTLGYGKAPSPPAKRPESNGIPSQKETPFSGEIKTFYASCEIPLRIDSDVWTSSANFHLYFKFPIDFTNSTLSTSSNKKSPKQRTFSTISAKLKLFKNAKIPTPQILNETEIIERLVNPTGTSQNLEVMEERIRVSVFWYKAPVTKIHYKKKLLDTKMISVKDSKWVEFDIINAAVPWLDHHDKNFGLVVQVENEDNDLMDATSYFSNVHCSNPDNSSNISIYTTPQLNPPQVEICILNTPQPQRPVEVVTEPPFPFMGESFSMLSRVAKSHANKAQSDEEASNTSESEWQNDFEGSFPSATTTTTHRPKNQHKHRHGHGQQGAKHTNTPRKSRKEASETSPLNFELEEDHPLRRILATVATNVHSNNRRNSRHHQMQNSQMSSGESEDDDGNIIIQKIYISRPNSGSSSSTDGNADPVLNR